MPSAGIVGIGIQGRLLAWQLALQGWQITVFDKRDETGRGSCSYAAGGMLSPVLESLSQAYLIYELGWISVSYWKNIISHFRQPIFFQQQGSMMVAHPQDNSDFEYIDRRLRGAREEGQVHTLDAEAIKSLEPELHFREAYFFPKEAQIDARSVLNALWEELKILDVNHYFHTTVTRILPHVIATEDHSFSFDWVFDCRGVGAQMNLSDLRCVRGELMYLHAPAVDLMRPVRLLHPRYPLYIIPRLDHRYLVGATEIESADDSPLSVRSSLELLSAAYSVHAGFAEARISETVTGLRPAFSDNLPRLYYQPGLIRMNGLYRHGFLIAPLLVEEALRLCKQGISASHYPMFIREVVYD